MTVHYLPLDLVKTPRENLFDMIKHANRNEPWVDALTPDSFYVHSVEPLTQPYEIVSEDGEAIMINSVLRIQGQGLWRGTQLIEYSRIDLTDLQMIELVGDEGSGNYIKAAKIGSVIGIATSSIASNSTVISTNIAYGINERDDAHIKKYLKLHPTVNRTGGGTLSSGKGALTFKPHIDLFDSASDVTSKALYIGQLKMAFSRT